MSVICLEVRLAITFGTRYRKGLGKRLNSSCVSSLHSDHFKLFFSTLQKQVLGSASSRGTLRFQALWCACWLEGASGQNFSSNGKTL